MTVFSNWSNVVEIFDVAGRMPTTDGILGRIERARVERAVPVLERGHRRIATWPNFATWIAKRGPQEAARRQDEAGAPAGADGPEIQQTVVRAILDEAAFVIVDWHAAMMDDPTHKIARMAYAEAKAAAERWHAGKAKRWAKEHRRLAKGPAVGEGVKLESFDGRYWALLTTRDALRQESIRMHHCVGWDTSTYASLYVDDPGPYPEGIWSLRSCDGRRSLLTAEIDENGVIVQCLAVCNAEPPPSLVGDVRVLEMTLSYASFNARFSDETPGPGAWENSAEARRLVRDVGL